jgi:uncharacterized protein YjbJ (UPF0337 family)
MFESLGKMLNAVGKSLVKFSLLITGVVIFINAFIITPLPAHADSLNSIQALIGFDAPNTMEGTLDQIQGKAQQNLGTAQRKAGEMTGQTEGALNQAKGKAQQGVGEVKNRLDNASDNAEEASENMLDSVKNLFGQ